MKFENCVYPNREQMKGFFEENNDDQAVFMVNLLKFKDKAEYKDGRETNLTGSEAYAIYGKIMEKHLKEIGGELIFKSKITRMTIGKVEELWDAVAIVKWPSKESNGGQHDAIRSCIIRRLPAQRGWASRSIKY